MEEKRDDPLLIWLCVIGALCSGVFSIWYFKHETISYIYANIRYFESLPLLIADTLSGHSRLFPQHQDWLARFCAPKTLFDLCHASFSDTRWHDLIDSSLSFNLLWLFILVTFCIRMFWIISHRHPKVIYTKRHNIASFIEESKKLYAHLRLFSAIDLNSVALDDDLFGMSLTSRQFIFKHRLVLEWQPNTLQPILNRTKAAKIFKAQLGSLWTDHSQLTPAETLLVAIAIPRIVAADPLLDDQAFAAAKAESNELLNWCWTQFKPPSGKTCATSKDHERFDWLRPRFDLSGPVRIISKYISHRNVQDIISQHAYARTIIYAMFIRARQFGVLQPAELRWLRFYDRQLWYLIESAGRQACFVEAAGIQSHYLFESKAKTFIAEPQVDKALDGLEQALQKFYYSSIDKEQYENHCHDNSICNQSAR